MTKPKAVDKALPADHSPLGGSAAYRYIKCPGSVNMAQGIENEESEHATLGTAAHDLVATCLVEGADAWEFVGGWAEANGEEVEIDAEMAEAGQTYLDEVRKIETIRPKAIQYVEFPFHAKDLHPHMYGRADYVAVDKASRTLYVWDYKHGVGITVEVKDNPQLLYYAAGVMDQLNLWQDIDVVNVGISQPRGFHPDGPNRSHSYATAEVMSWLTGTLIPAMKAAETSRETVAGEHCRFCPARSHACPAMLKNTLEISRMAKVMDGKGGAAQLTPEEMGHTLSILAVGKIADKAVRSVALARLNKDQEVPGWKMVNGRVNRAWKDGAQMAAYNEYGSQAFKPEMEAIVSSLIQSAGRKEAGKMLTVDLMRTPAQMNKLPSGEKFCARWASKPPAPRTLAPATDARRGVSTSTKAMFKPVKK